MARGKTDVPILFSWSQEAVRRIGASVIVDFHGRSPTREPPVGGRKAGNENNIQYLMGIRME